jgi:hypothetical protein
MDLSYVMVGLLMAVYPRTAMSATDPNEDVAHMIEEGGGRIFGLMASLNTRERIGIRPVAKRSLIDLSLFWKCMGLLVPN